MALGSVAASAAVGTRQFGVALPAGLVLTWLLGRSRLEKTLLYLTGLILPGLTGLWQVSLGLTHPSFTQVMRLAQTVAYLHRGLPVMLVESVYRLAVLMEYLGLFLLPLTPVLLFPYVRDFRSAGYAGEGLRRWRGPALMVTAWMLLMGIYGLSYYWVNGTIRNSLMPSIGWVMKMDGRVKRALMTVATTTCGALLGLLLSIRYRRLDRWRLLSPGETMLVSSGVVMFVLNVLYVQYCDTYLTVYIPAALMATAKELPHWPRRWRVLHLMACVPVIALACLWTRASLVEEEVYWQAAEEIRLRGVIPNQVAGDLRWSGYYGCFDDWVADIGGINGITKYDVTDSRSPLNHSTFDAFMNRRTGAAEYLLQPRPTVAGDRSGQIVKTVVYPGMFLKPKALYVIRREASRSQAPR